jgi:RNase H-fold protein (predicted Holliday junction resolvase)
MERLIAVDYGRRRIGVAGCDPLGIAVVPLLALRGSAGPGDPAHSGAVRHESFFQYAAGSVAGTSIE